MIVDRINEYLSKEKRDLSDVLLDQVAILARDSFKRQFGEREEQSPTLRLSSIGRCVRQQAYKKLGTEENGKTLDSRALMVFFQGDMAELAIVMLAKAAGCDITDCQKEVEIDGVKGHIDGLLHADADYLLEVKSMSSYGFAEFQRGILDDGYRFQINAYAHALGLKQAIVVGLNKDAGVLHETVISKDQAIVDEIKNRISILKDVKVESLPERPYAPNEKGFLPWQCRYCAFYQTCWPTSELVLSGKAYKLKIPKETPHHATPTPA